MYIATLTDLKYPIHAIGNTQEECKKNMLKGFKAYMKSFKITFAEWIEEVGVDYTDYGNDMWRFLSEYYGVHMFNVTKGYALGWE